MEKTTPPSKAPQPLFKLAVTEPKATPKTRARRPEQPGSNAGMVDACQVLSLDLGKVEEAAKVTTAKVGDLDKRQRAADAQIEGVVKSTNKGHLALQRQIDELRAQLVDDKTALAISQKQLAESQLALRDTQGQLNAARIQLRADIAELVSLLLRPTGWSAVLAWRNKRGHPAQETDGED